MFLFIPILLVECLLCRVALNPSLNTDATVFSLLLLLINSAVVFGLLTKAIPGEKEKKLNQMLVASFAIHLACLLWDVFAKDIFILPNAEGDAIGYETVAASYAFGWRQNLVVLNDYSFWAGQLYKLLGRQPVTIQFINVFLAMWSVVLIHKAAVLLNISYEGRKTMVAFLCFLPNTIVITSIFLRESLIAFCVSASVYFFTLWWKKNQAVMLLLSLLFSLVGGCFHVGGLACAIGYLSTCLFIGGRQRRITINMKSVCRCLIIIFVALTIVFTHKAIFLSKVGDDITVDNIVSHAGVTDRASDAEYSVGFAGLPPVLDLVVNSPIRMICFLAAPMPWMWRGPKDILAFFGSALFYLLTLKEVWKSFNISRPKQSGDEWLRNYLIVSLAVLLVATLMFGWGVSNVGTALRHREKFTCLFALVYAIAIQRQKNTGLIGPRKTDAN